MRETAAEVGVSSKPRQIRIGLPRLLRLRAEIRRQPWIQMSQVGTGRPQFMVALLHVLRSRRDKQMPDSTSNKLSSSLRSDGLEEGEETRALRAPGSRVSTEIWMQFTAISPAKPLKCGEEPGLVGPQVHYHSSMLDGGSGDHLCDNLEMQLQAACCCLPLMLFKLCCPLPWSSHKPGWS